MSVHEVTLLLPDSVYEQIRLAAEKVQKRVDDILTEAIAAAAPVAGDTQPRTRSALAQMAYLNDAALWQAARATVGEEQRTRLADLHRNSQETGLTPEEKMEEQALLTRYRETLLVRAQATVLLKQRGYDVSNPSDFQPLS